ncbi:pseudouridine synthase [Tabrizicola sp. TH137]|uniref:pseudouridine synthase n=1 Tax=Tabrizicola sp. TH137 TaxID=2067452 RepID=UPI000C7DCBF3|nr:pseudouridine synthase [Tabrizicola sp. TH137]PLL12602.1 pseudouridine synthase [Tabrizicola sp. TH137]
MTRPPKSPSARPAPEGDRIAKVLSRAGIASRREAERMIAAGEVAVNGKVIDSPALNVTAKDRITVNGQPLAPPEPPRLWLYYKPEGLVTSAADEKGRDTVFDHLPEDMPRVMSIGRLDLNSEGLLLLTNDGELKRRLELPSTGWLRKYRVRVKGNPTDPDLEPLRQGITVEGERFQPMQVALDRLQGANAWLTVGLREGKNREIRRAMSAIGLTVNRLIRVSYGPFRLNELQPGEVEEVRPRVLRDQLGFAPDLFTATDAAPRKPAPARPAKPAARSDSAPRPARGPKPDTPTTRGPIPGPRPDSSAPRPARGPKAEAKTARPTRGGKPSAPRGTLADAPAPRPAKPGPAKTGPAKPGPRSPAKPKPQSTRNRPDAAPGPQGKPRPAAPSGGKPRRPPRG